MRLGGWQRIGVVLTALWIVAGGLWVNSLVIEQMGAGVTAGLSACLAARSIQPDGSIPKDTDWGPCNRRFDQEWPKAVSGHWTYAIIGTLVPIPVAWGFVYAMAALFRWVAAGFRQKRENSP
jgi:hypothetical protein